MSTASEARPFRTMQEAAAALAAALKDVEPDDPVHAVQRVATIARRCRLPGDSSWEAFRWAAEKAVRPYFDRRALPPAKAATWAVVDPYFGQLDREEDPRGRNRPLGGRARTAVDECGEVGRRPRQPIRVAEAAR